MKIVGLTGGIGSGKTTVAKLFAELGIPTYIADEEAKTLMNTSSTIKREISALFGDQAYTDGSLNRPFIANAIFNDTGLLKQMNSIVHPRVGRHFKEWVQQQNALYVIKENAILFEHGEEKNCDFTILVTAPENIRISRVVKRDNKTEAQVKAIINNQLPEGVKRLKATYIIENTALDKTRTQVLDVHHKLLNAMKTS
ncbi:dephospho-CoA kinase [Bizionia myxarmorum]|uniref:Dephospho-CoA kinase n=1 Tax=Bizionia myxarmorum TaxID=291186 RepID=A0A5D0RDT9_9FLAO|nr:dephospho-CoA kinase [Bizionia myxarmorum]TYB79672.1 dephospho-CoA kinase [Bizionia myxarmorum]